MSTSPHQFVPDPGRETYCGFTVDGKVCGCRYDEAVHNLSIRMAAIFTDNVNPAHYNVGDIYEHVKVVDAWGLSYQLGCATKYMVRAGKKDPAKHVEDLRKAIRYIELEINRIGGTPS